jgi:hypothetical protein
VRSFFSFVFLSFFIGFFENSCADELNSLEKLRDPSHVRFYTQTELIEMMKRAGLGNTRAESYRVDSLLSDWLNRSFFASDADRTEFIRRIADDVERTGNTKLDLRMSKEGGDVVWSHMVSILTSDKQ